MKEVAGEYRKRAGRRMPAELILIGGASVLINYGFRNMTADIDAVIHASSSMKDAVNTVGDRFGLSNGWLNDDFKKNGFLYPETRRIFNILPYIFKCLNDSHRRCRILDRNETSFMQAV